MKQVRENTLFGERLKEGRVFRKMTQNELARELDVSKQAISQYETGVNLPKLEIMEKIYEVLDLPCEYFMKEVDYHITTPVFFRKLKTAAKKEHDSFEVTIHWMINIYRYLKQFVNFPEPNFPHYDKDEYTFDEVQKIAVEVRKFWGLGIGPISNVNLLLENNGFIISKIKKNTPKVDACSILASLDGISRPFIFLSSDKSAVRSRFDAAHELGHHVLHYGMDKEMYEERKDEIEKEANWFASAFLVPENAIRREIFLVNSLDSFLTLKKRWLVSVACLIHLCSDLELLDSKQIESYRKRLSARGWRKREPLDDLILHEDVNIFGKALELILEADIQKPKDIIESLCLPKKEIADLSGVDLSLLEIPEEKRPILQLIKSS